MNNSNLIQANYFLLELQKLEKISAELKVDYCIYCKSYNIIKHGKYKHLHRYKCKNCKRTFIPTTGTTIHYLNKRIKFLEYYSIVSKFGKLTIKELREKLGICSQTAFDWRHKLFTTYSHEFRLVEGMIYLKNIEKNFSQKGRKFKAYNRNLKKNAGKTNLISYGDNNFIYSKTVKIGNYDKQDLDRVLKKSFNHNVQIIYSGNENFRKFIEGNLIKKAFCLDDKSFFGNEVKKIYYDIKTLELNKTISLKFRGVATKYLQLYSNFFSSFLSAKTNYELTKLINNNLVWFKFVQMEKIYEKLLRRVSKIDEQFVHIKRYWKNEDRFTEFRFESLIGY
ncbi:MAG TPA: hypothetical protein P5538_07815 [Bacteroidales bacterium]|nr:hypothetical protein [Bacteroidales bacterium]HOL97660.1 hypothetical protein [Bacteroidales bacterium]HOM37086.1 hypothetical protein [Bacteroidales bacterium]HPD24396.1 hypothetical protein [Bacteroidales bacterium]HRT00270.1 hypothetical protein [Bacteroidales bacterium]